jgi:hypothetical protein
MTWDRMFGKTGYPLTRVLGWGERQINFISAESQVISAGGGGTIVINMSTHR